MISVDYVPGNIQRDTNFDCKKEQFERYSGVLPEPCKNRPHPPKTVCCYIFQQINGEYPIRLMNGTTPY